jgi:hypothetical protein
VVVEPRSRRRWRKRKRGRGLLNSTLGNFDNADRTHVYRKKLSKTKMSIHTWL